MYFIYTPFEEKRSDIVISLVHMSVHPSVCLSVFNFGTMIVYGVNMTTKILDYKLTLEWKLKVKNA